MKIYQFSLFFALTLALTTRNSDAYSRAYVPLNVAVAKADAIVEARTTRVPESYQRAGSTAEVDIKHVFKGSLEPGAITVQLRADHPLALGMLELGKDYLLFLRKVGDEEPEFEVLLDGTRLHTEEDAKSITSAVELTPAWSPPSDGLSTVLTAERFRVKVDEDLTLWVGCRNTSDRTITFKYRTWPIETHSHWTLKISTESEAEIEALPHPALTQEEISDYFSRFPHSSEVVLAPGMETFFPLPRVNTAQPGMGYKERLNYKYYPMDKPGKYAIEATAHHFLEDSVFSAKGLTVWVE